MQFPIVIIGAAPRCGSTPYAQLMQQKTGLPCFHEPWHRRIIEESTDYNEKQFAENPLMYKQKFIHYLNFKKTSNRYIVKLFFDDIEHRCPYHQELAQGYKIGLFRRNIVDQVASYYIAIGRRQFHDHKDALQKSYTINIDPTSISILIKHVTRARLLLENSSILDKRVYYEDIDFSELHTPYQPTFQSLNLSELKNAIQDIMNETIPNHWQYGWNATFDETKMKITEINIFQ